MERQRSYPMYNKRRVIFYFPLGSIFNSVGERISFPNNNSKGLYGYKIKIDGKKDYQEEGLFKLMRGSLMPQFKPQYEDDLVYKNAPYYRCRQGSITFIVPSHVINSYFYYFSNLAIFYICYNEIKDIFKSPIFNSEAKKYEIGYNNMLAEESESLYLSGFCFSKGHKKIRYLKNIPLKFNEELLNNNDNNKKVKVYMGGGIPSDSLEELMVLGQYITPYDPHSTERIIFVYRIMNHYFDIFEDIDYELIKEIDTRSIENKEGKETVKSSNVAGVYKGTGEITSTKTDTAINTSISIKNIVDNNMIPFCSERPKSIIQDKKSQKEWYESRKTIPKDVESRIRQYTNRDSHSTIGRLNTTAMDSDLDFRLFREALFELDQSQNYTIEVIDIPSWRDLNYRIVASICFLDSYYYIFEFGRGITITIISQEDSKLKIEKTKLIDILDVCERFYKNKLST